MRAAALALIAVLPACSGEPPPCGRLPECDIRDDDCQREVLAIASCVRGQDEARVPVRVVDFDAYVDSALADAGELDPAVRMRREQLYRALALLDLAPSGLTVEAAVEQDLAWVAAFYDGDAGEIVILDRGQPLRGVNASAILLHELVHALQDAAHDFDRLYDAQSEGSDGASAVSALIEGEAVVHSDRATADALGYEASDVDWDDLYRRYGTRASSALAQSASPLIEVDSWFVYAFGARFVHAAFARDGQEGVAALYDDPPASARQIALGHGRAEPDGGDWLEPELDAEALPPAPDGFAPIAELHLGAYLAHVFAGRPDPELVAAPLAASASDRLRADVLTVQVGPDGELLVGWRLRFARAGAAEDFLAALARPRLPDAAWVQGRDVILMAATDAALLDAPREPSAWRALPSDDEPAAAAAAASGGIAPALRGSAISVFAPRVLCRRPLR